MNKFLLPFLLLFVLVSSCKSTKISSNSVDKKSTIKQLEKNIATANYTFNNVQAKAKINFNDGKMNQNFTANIRIKDEQTIWLSLTGPFGIEGARVLIEKDRIQILDKLNNAYYDEPFSFINTYLPFPTDINSDPLHQGQNHEQPTHPSHELDVEEGTEPEMLQGVCVLEQVDLSLVL